MQAPRYLPQFLLLGRLARPQTLDEYVGQEHLLGPGGALTEVFKGGHPTSLILYGPPGIGKTTFARLLQKKTTYRFDSIYYIGRGKLWDKDFNEVLRLAVSHFKKNKAPTALFVDEIHRCLPEEQEALDRAVEKGIIKLIAATIVRPKNVVIPSLLTKCKIVELKLHTEHDLRRLLKRILGDKERGLGLVPLHFEKEAQLLLCRSVNGDARRLIKILRSELTKQYFLKKAKKKGAAVMTFRITSNDIMNHLRSRQMMSVD